MRECTRCGKSSRDGQIYCQHCGQRLTDAPPATSSQAGAPIGWDWPPHPTAQDDTDQRVVSDAAVGLEVRPHESAGEAKMDVGTSASGRLALTSLEGMTVSNDFVLDGRNVTIGRAPACTISLPDDQLASRLHAMLHFTGDHYTVSDLGSINGTLVNGALIQDATVLANGDRISVGQHVVTYYSSERMHTLAPSQPPATTSFAIPESVEQTSSLVPTDQTGAAATATDPADPDAEHSPDSMTADSATRADLEPATAPLPAIAASGGTPWVMPAQPQWAGGPSQAPWSAPEEDKPPELETTDSDSGYDEENAPAPAAEAPRWSIEGHAWNQDAAELPSANGWWPAPGSGSSALDLNGHALPESSTSATISVPLRDAIAMEQAPATGELDQLRTQLMRSSEQLARWNESAATHSRQLRTDLAELAREFAQVLSETQGATEPLTELVQLARDAARDPHHVNTVVAMASRSEDIAQALSNQERLVAAVRLVHQRLLALSGQG